MDFLVQIRKPVDIDDDDLSSDENILKWQYDIITRWKNTTETFFLIKGPPSLGILGAISGIFIHNHYRRKLKLGTYGRATSYLPIVVLPALVAPLVHKMVVQTRILLSDYNCPVCLQVRSGLIHTSLAVLYPGLLAPLASFMYATRHFTYRIPSITQNPKEIFLLWAKLTRPIATPIVGLLLANYFAAMYVTYAEIRDFHTIMKTVEENIPRLEGKS